MQKERQIDDAQARLAESAKRVRALAAQVEIDLEAISYYAADLRHKMEFLHKELEVADPVKDQLFYKFIYKLQRFVLPLQSPGELKKLTKVMQKFGMPNAEEIAAIIKSQQTTVNSQRSNIRIQIPNVQKYLIEEPINA